MAIRIFTVVAAVTLLLTAADKKPPSSARGENQDLILTVTLYDEPAAVKQLLGTDLDGHYMVADVKVDGLRAGPVATVYQPRAQRPWLATCEVYGES